MLYRRQYVAYYDIFTHKPILKSVTQTVTDLKKHEYWSEKKYLYLDSLCRNFC